MKDPKYFVVIDKSGNVVECAQLEDCQTFIKYHMGLGLKIEEIKVDPVAKVKYEMMVVSLPLTD